MNTTLRAAVADAIEMLMAETGRDADALLGERLLEPAQMSAAAAHAMGIIEGAGLAFRVTALELLDALLKRG